MPITLRDHALPSATSAEPEQENVATGALPPDQPGPLDQRRHRPLAAALIVLTLCGLGIITIARNGWPSTDDGAAVVPIVALVSIALGSIRWRPEDDVAPSRAVSVRVPIVVATAAAALVGAVIVRPEIEPWAIGPVMSVALLGTYLGLWGYRALALFRTITVLSFLTWQPVAEFVHAVVRSSLEQPSEIIYRRLAELGVFGVGDEPWRLFSAELHRGPLVVIATLVLAMGANRWRLSGRNLADLTVTTACALIIHHVVILSSAIDAYDPDGVTQVATNPTIELAISGGAVAVLSLVRFRRFRREESIDLAEASAPAHDPTVDRDPVIFAMVDRTARPAATALLLTGVAPLVAISLIG